MKLLFLASRQPFTDADLKAALHVARSLGLKLAGDGQWLASTSGQGRPAASVRLHEAVTLTQARQLREHLASHQVDALCLPGVCPRPRLLLADMDSTVVAGETLDELAVVAGKGQQVQAITTQAMNGSLNFGQALTQRVAMLKGTPASHVEEVIRQTCLSEGAERLIRTLRAQGTRCVLVSGGFTRFMEVVCAQCGFDAYHGNTLDVQDGVITGTVTPPILDSHAKLAYLRHHAQELGIALTDAMALGDGANDLPMLEAAGLGIGYRPKPAVEAMLVNVLKYAPMDDLLLMFDAQG